MLRVKLSVASNFIYTGIVYSGIVSQGLMDRPSSLAVFVSADGGVTWREGPFRHQDYASADMGAVIVSVKKNKIDATSSIW